MEYYGNNDWRNYLQRQNTLAHFGIPRRSGRYAWGSGENPYHHGADAPSGRRVKKRLKDNVKLTPRQKTLERMNNGTASETVQKIEKAIKKADSYTNSDNLKENATKAMKKVDEYSNTLKRGEAISKSVLSNPERKLSKKEVWDLEDYADQLFYNNTGGPSESWTSKEAESEYYKLRKIIDKYN